MVNSAVRLVDTGHSVSIHRLERSDLGIEVRLQLLLNGDIFWRVLISLSVMQVKEAESSTKESDRSSVPHPHSHAPRSKPKSKSPKVPPMWGPGFPGFPLGPPPMPGFRMVSRP